jgi:hypothetical protein
MVEVTGCQSKRQDQGMRNEESGNRIQRGLAGRLPVNETCWRREVRGVRNQEQESSNRNKGGGYLNLSINDLAALKASFIIVTSSRRPR